MPSILTKKAFKAWLENETPSNIIGFSRMACECPIARYLKNHTGMRYVVSDSDFFEHANTGNARYGKHHPTPKWAADFIRTIDATYRHRVRVKDALFVLNQI